MWFWNEEDRCICWWLARANLSLIEYFLNVFLEYWQFFLRESVDGSPRGFLSSLDVNSMVKGSKRWQEVGDFSIIQRLVISILLWNHINPINFHFIIITDFRISNDSKPSRFIPEIQYSIMDFNGEWIAVMLCACPLALLVLKADFSSFRKFLGFMFDNPPIWKHQITGIFHGTNPKGFVGILVSMLAGNWEGVTPSAILHCISSKVLNFLLVFASDK